MKIEKNAKARSYDISELRGGLTKKDLKGNKSLESVFDAIDTTGDGILTDNEIQMFKEQIDADKNETIGKRETRKFAKANNLKREDVVLNLF